MDGYVTIKTTLDNSDFDREIGFLQDKLESLEEEYNIISREKPFEGQEKSLRNLSSQILTTKKRMQQLRKEQDKINNLPLNSIKDSIQDITKSLKNTVNTVIRWGLALIGLSGIMSLVRSSMATLTQYDKQLEADINYMRFALAEALRPVIEWIIKALYTILKLVGQIIYTFTGYNIFKNSGIGEYEKAMSSSEKSAKRLQKTLAGFDEMNILQENGGDKTGGGGGGTTLPNLGDLAKEVEMEPPEWMIWILKHKDEVIAGLVGIAGALGAVALGFGGLKAIGIGLVFTGITLSYEGIQNFINGDYGWKTILETIFGPVAMGVGAFMITKNITVALAVTAIGLTINAGVEIKKLFDEMDTVLKENKKTWTETWKLGAVTAIQIVKEKFSEFKDDVTKKFNEIGEKITGNSTTWETWKKIYSNIFRLFTGDFTGVKDSVSSDFTNINDAINENGGWWESWKQGIGIIFGKVMDDSGYTAETIWGDLDEINKAIKDNGGWWSSWKQGVTLIWETTKKTFKEKWNKSSFGQLEQAIRDNGGVWKSWKQGITTIFDKIKDSFKKAGNFFNTMKENWQKGMDLIVDKVRSFKNKINEILGKINPVNLISKGISAITGHSKGAVAYYRKGGIVLPKLGIGGIINQPGRGVPLASAIGGEHGAEGVIPLTDSQQMMLLGEAIGRYITINANITNTMNGRVISRELQKINNESDFAFNR